MANHDERPAVAPVSTDGFAIASLVLGLLGISVLGLILGFVGLSRTRRGGAGGRGFAVAGIALSAVWLVATIGLFGWLLFAVNSTVSTTQQPASPPVQLGDCIDNSKGGFQVLLPGARSTLENRCLSLPPTRTAVQRSGRSRTRTTFGASCTPRRTITGHRRGGARSPHHW